ncbi:hypothetical protein Taro_004982 [Colocasia esculenta]|uniref:UDP-glucuronic acid decarboxylase 1 n=1 Tax=Colocasia esculenta TaxID=4460 RepID=A0A843TWI8_COLES|nr:hypothetical protein [Colocasia esculenta]
MGAQGSAGVGGGGARRPRGGWGSKGQLGVGWLRGASSVSFSRHGSVYTGGVDGMVIVVDNFFTSSKDNLREWIGHPRFELIRHDVTETLLVEVDQIYHLACPASPIFYKYNPVKTIKTNVIGTLNMLGLAKRVGARILLTSTSEAYGDPLEHPQKEEYWGNVNPIEVEALAVVLVEIIEEVKAEAEV